MCDQSSFTEKAGSSAPKGELHVLPQYGNMYKRQGELSLTEPRETEVALNGKVCIDVIIDKDGI